MYRVALFAIALVAACGQDTGTLGSDAEAASPKKKAADPAPAAGEPADAEVVAGWEGGQITWGQLRERTAGELRGMEIQHLLSKYELQQQALDQLVMQGLLEAEAKRLGHASVDALLMEEIEKKTPKPTDQQVADFYPVVARQLGGASLEEARPLLEQELTRRAQQEAFTSYVQGLRERSGIQATLPYPDLPRIDVKIADHDPVKGDAKAPVTIVQFAEYQCYYCGVAAPTLDKVLANYEGKVKVVYKDYPLGSHPRAIPAAVAAHCAGEQKKYWEYNSVLFEQQQKSGEAALRDDALTQYARDLSLDLGAFDQCRASGKWEPTIQEDVAAGNDAGVSGTPAFLINGVFVSGAQPYERFAGLIDRELAKD
jgi:protein-disulfide isomerase